MFELIEQGTLSLFEGTQVNANFLASSLCNPIKFLQKSLTPKEHQTEFSCMTFAQTEVNKPMLCMFPSLV